MYVIVDYENVSARGLNGVDLLKADDTLAVFYSDNCDRIESILLQKIMATGCHYKVCKLVNKGNNALDFYISVRVGEILASKAPGPILIISRDHGFNAVLDYCGSMYPEVVICCDETILDAYKQIDKESIANKRFTMEQSVDLYNSAVTNLGQEPRASVERAASIKREKSFNIPVEKMLELCGVDPSAATQWETFSDVEKARIVKKLISVRDATDDDWIRSMTGRAMFMLNFTKAMNKCASQVSAYIPDNRDFMQIFKSVFSGALRQWDENWKNFDPEETTLEEYMNETFGPLLSKPENPEGSAPEENKE